MANMPSTKIKSGSESQADISDDLTMSGQVEVSDKSGSVNSSPATSADTPKGSPRTWTSAALEELRLRAGLVAGAFSDFQAAGGLVAVKNVETSLPSGSNLVAVKVYLVAEGLSVKVMHTADGLDFDIQPLPSGSLVAEPSGSEQ